MNGTFFGMLCMAGGGRIWATPGEVGRRCRAANFSRPASGLGMTVLYALLSGFSVLAQRTVLMLAAFLLARESGRSSTPA